MSGYILVSGHSRIATCWQRLDLSAIRINLQTNYLLNLKPNVHKQKLMIVFIRTSCLESRHCKFTFYQKQYFLNHLDIEFHPKKKQLLISVGYHNPFLPLTHQLLLSINIIYACYTIKAFTLTLGEIY